MSQAFANSALRTIPYLKAACLLLALLASNGPSRAAELSSEEAQVRFLVEICKHIRWRDEAAMERFEIAVVSANPALGSALRALDPPQLRGKPLHFQLHASADFDPGGYAMIYLADRYRALHEHFSAAAPRSLIVLDSALPRERLQISIVAEGEQLGLQLNRENLLARGLTPSMALLEFAGSRQDLSEELRRQQGELERLLREVAAQNAQLAELEQQRAASLQSAREELARGQRDLRQSEQQLQGLQRDIELANLQIVAHQRQIDEQQARIKEKEALLATQEAQVQAREKQIAELAAAVNSNRQILEVQLSQLERQRQQLQAQEQTISSQRQTLGWVSAVALLILLGTLLLMRLNRLRKRANLELERLNDRLYQMATTDSLSGLANRRHFLRSARDLFSFHHSQGVPMALLMLDIDHFKQVNDRHGHAAGDEVIKAVAGVLHEQLRDQDLVGRLGGEEFAMLLVSCDGDHAAEVAERLRQRVAALTIHHENAAIPVTISIGVAAATASETRLEAALLRADQALYVAKQRGRNQVVGAPADTATAVDGQAVARVG